MMTPDPKRKKHTLPKGWVKRLEATNETMLRNLPFGIKPAESPYQSMKKGLALKRLKKNPYYSKIMESKTIQDLAINIGIKLFEDVPKNVLNSKKDIAKIPLKERMMIYNKVADNMKNTQEKTALALALRLQEAFKKKA